MTVITSIQRSRDLTIFVVEGTLTFDEQLRVLRQFYEGTPTANVIWDFRLVTGNRISSSEVQKIISFIKRRKSKRRRGKTALVSSTDLDFGLSRMGEVYAESECLPWEIQAFRSMDEAMAWIDSE